VTQPSEPAGALAEAIHAVARGADLDARLGTLLALAMADRNASAAVVAVLGDDGLVRPLATAGGRAGRPAPAAPHGEAAGAAAADDPLAKAILERRPVVAASAGDGAAAGWFATAQSLERVLAVPLVVVEEGIERAVGALGLGWRDGSEEAPGAAGVLDAAADLAALAVAGSTDAAGAAEQADWQERLAHLDPLTGLANRRTLDRILELEIARAGRQRSEVSVAAFDVDGFRAANAAHGSAHGDDVLRSIAAVLAGQVRLVDTVARIGGDEFVLVAPGSGGVVVADRILRAVEALGGAGDATLTVSAGIARFPDDGTSAEELLDAALGALAGARSSGPGSLAEVRPA